MHNVFLRICPSRVVRTRIVYVTISKMKLKFVISVTDLAGCDCLVRCDVAVGIWVDVVEQWFGVGCIKGLIRAWCVSRTTTDAVTIVIVWMSEFQGFRRRMRVVAIVNANARG